MWEIYTKKGRNTIVNSYTATVFVNLGADINKDNALSILDLSFVLHLVSAL
jgi:hypothetical protein